MAISSLITRASEFAQRAHAGQKYGELPYDYHLAKVAAILNLFGVTDEELIAAAWLHDTIEDTDTTLEHIEFLFGKRVGALVWAVTDGEGKNRKERKRAMYEKVRQTPGAVLLKLADRIANVSEGINTKSKLRYMYLAEHEGFMREMKHGRTASFSVAENLMWNHLDGLIAEIGEGV